MRLASPDRPRARASRLLAGAAGVVALAFGAVAAPANAAAVGTGSIDGVVTGAAGAPLADVFVQLEFCDPDFDPATQRDCWTLLWGDGQDARSGADGAFAITGLEAGDYRVSLSPQASVAQYIREYYDGADLPQDATIVEVADGAATTITPTLEVGASITGTVLDETGAPVSGGFVYAYQTGYDGGTRGGASVQSDGSYAIQGLPTGEYRLQAGPSWGAESTLATEWWQDAWSRDDATPVDLVAGDALEADWVLEEGAVVEGVVTSGGAPAEGVEVQLTSPNAYGSWDTGRTAVTDAAGAYRVDGVADGDYAIRFGDFDGEAAHEYWPDVADRASAELVALTPGDVLGDVDADLAPGGAIGGAITQIVDGATAPAERAYVDVLRRDTAGAWERVTSVTSDATGAYAVSGLGAGEYTLQVSGSAGGWASPWLGGGYYEAEAETVDIAAGAPVTGADVELERGVMIRGSIRDEDGGPAPGARMEVLLERDGEWVAAPPASGAGDDIGFLTGPFPPGRYIIRFSDDGTNDEPYVTQYWEGAATEADATVLEGASGGDFIDIDVVMRRAAP